MFKRRKIKKGKKLDFNIKNEKHYISTPKTKEKKKIDLKSVNFSNPFIKKQKNEEKILDLKFVKKKEKEIDYKKLIDDEKKKLDLLINKKDYKIEKKDNKKKNNLLEEIKKYEQKIIEENEEKPFWSIGLIELETDEKDKLELIFDCEKVINKEIENKLLKKFFGEKKKLIADEDIVATGNIWGISKNLLKRQKLEREKVKIKFMKEFKQKNKLKSFN